MHTRSHLHLSCVWEAATPIHRHHQKRENRRRVFLAAGVILRAQCNSAFAAVPPIFFFLPALTCVCCFDDELCISWQNSQSAPPPPPKNNPVSWVKSEWGCDGIFNLLRTYKALRKCIKELRQGFLPCTHRCRWRHPSGRQQSGPVISYIFVNIINSAEKNEDWLEKQLPIHVKWIKEYK